MNQPEDNQYRKLFTGWECTYEYDREKCYSPNYFTKTVQYVDPRQRYRLLENSCCSNESIALKRNGSSPLSIVKIAPNRQNLTPQFMPRRCTIQETSLTQNTDIDIMVQKIQNMFPTAGENHIRLLLKKYYNREAVVISALQVEKHPVIMPGPYVTPPVKRNLYHNTPSSSSLERYHYIGSGSFRNQDLISLSCNNSRSVSPAQYYNVMHNEKNVEHYRDIDHIPFTPLNQKTAYKLTEDIQNKTKISSSPKMKLRYMKAIFPKADEALIFDILANADNNIQTATNKLMSIGYTKRDASSTKNIGDKQRHIDIQTENEKTKNLEKSLGFKTYSQEEKLLIKKKLVETYTYINEDVLLMALESVNYDEERAKQILQIVQEEEAERQIAGNITKGRPSDCKTRENKTLQSPKQKESITINLKDQCEAKNLNINRDNVLSLSCKSLSSSSTSSSTTLSSPFISNFGLLDTLKRNLPTNSYLRSTSQTCVTASLWKILSTNPRIKLPTLNNCTDNTNKVLFTEYKSEANIKLSNSKQNNGRLCLAKGPNENLLLADYVIWNGANPENYRGPKSIPAGPVTLRAERTYTACGHNPKLSNGPQVKLVKNGITS